MLDKNLLKTRGLSFGRSLQTAIKTVVMYSVDHPACEKLVQQSYAALNVLLKQAEQFTFGFMNKRVLLDHILVDDRSLGQLEGEFAKRGVGAVSFQVGVSLGEFKRVLALLAVKPKVIEEKGGINLFLEQNPIEGARIVLAKKRPTEDTELDMDPDSFRLAQGILGLEGGARVSALDVLLRTAGLNRPESFAGGAGEMFALASKATQAVLVAPEADPRALVTNLVAILQSLTPDYLFSCLPPGKQAELQGQPVEEIARDIVEDLAVGWAINHLANPPAGKTPIALEEDVLRVLLRGLKATRVAERLLQKLSKLVAEANLPPEVYDRIRQGLAWYGLSQKERHAELMGKERFSSIEFQRLIDHVKELLTEGKVGQAVAVVEHYFARLYSADPETQREQMARAPELLRAMAAPETLEFLRAVAEGFGQKLLNEKKGDGGCHPQLASCLNRTAQLFVSFRDFGSVDRIGQYLQRSQASDPAQHANCCGKALAELLTPDVADQLVEQYVQKREDPERARTAASLLRLLGPVGAEKVFQRLEEETVAGNRLRLISLFARLGSAGIQEARKRLADERWYIVRNACQILGELGDPELPRQLSRALRHSDARVQQAAVFAIVRCRAPDRARVLAESLPFLHPQILEATLDELAFLKDPLSADGLVKFLMLKKGSQAAALEKTVRVLAAIPSERAAEGLGEVLLDSGQGSSVRKIALDALRRSRSGFARQLLVEFARLAPDDPLAAEYEAASNPKSSPSKLA